MNEEYYHDGLQCCVISLRYNFEQKRGWIFFPEFDCCDMTACVDLFTRIDPRVENIKTGAGGVADTEYRRIGKGKGVDNWEAIPPPPKPRLFYENAS